MKYLLLFDIDGTILKFKNYNSKEIFRGMMKDIFGVEVPFSKMPDFTGMTDLQILKEIAKNINFDFNKVNEKLSDIWHRISKDFKQFCTPEFIDLIPGIIPLIELLSSNSDFVLGLQTGNFRDNAYAKLNAFDLGKYFEIGAFGSDFEDRNKLPPLAIERANNIRGRNIFNNKNTLVIGDSKRDIECAISNNLPILVVTKNNLLQNEYNGKLNHHFVDDFSNLEQIKSIINKIFDI